MIDGKDMIIPTWSDYAPNYAPPLKTLSEHHILTLERTLVVDPCRVLLGGIGRGLVSTHEDALVGDLNFTGVA